MSALEDLRYGLRTHLRSPGFTAVAVITVALGVGANTAIFSVVKTVLLKPLPFSNPDRLVKLWESNPRNPADEIMPVSPADFQDWRSRTHSFAEIGASYDVHHSLTGVGEPAALIGYAFSANVFHVLGLRLCWDRRSPPTKTSQGLIMWSFWRTRCGKGNSEATRALWARRLLSTASPIGSWALCGQDSITRETWSSGCRSQ